MDSVELTVWLNRRWYDALVEHLDGSLEDKLNEYLDELIGQLPAEARERVSGEIRAENQRREQEREAARCFAVFHVTEERNSVCFATQEPVEFLAAAGHLREYLRRPPGDAPARFVGMFRGERIAAEQFQAYASERMDNTGRVTGAFEIDLDRGEFAALNIMDGWMVYRVKDVSVAAYRAQRKQDISLEERWRIFLDHLEGKELTYTTPEPEETRGVRRLREEDIVFADEISEIDGLLNFYLCCTFNVDEVFGTQVETTGNDDYINVYANYDMAAGRVRDRLEITLCLGDGTDRYLCYLLDEPERAMLESGMESYCQEQTGMGLKEYSALFMAEEQEEGGMQAQRM